jgi:hypothetical protein
MTFTRPRYSALVAVLAAAAMILAGGCGGGGSTVGGGSGSQGSGSGGSGGGGGNPPPTVTNVLSVIADSGPTDPANPSAGPIQTVNTPFVSVTICAPGTSNCQTIDHISVDTGSVGLRVVAAVLSSSVAAALTAAMDTQGRPLAECLPFADGYSWGPVKLADAKLAGEQASGISIQVIGDPAYSTVPSACSSGGAQQEDTVSSFGANGILGVGNFQQDCGSLCATETVPQITTQLYYGCASPANCVATTVPLASQVWNPISKLPTDNNGSILELPAVASSGAATVTGSLIFGIDTESNNALGTATVLSVDPGTGNLTVNFLGQALSSSFLDSGSNGNFFTDSSLAQCTSSSEKGFYCPSGTQALSATLTSNSGVTTGTINFNVANADTLFSNGNGAFYVFNDLAGTNSLPQSFDFGLPFFLGRNVYTAIENSPTSAGMGPFVAF